jgi:hypothetical protein
MEFFLVEDVFCVIQGYQVTKVKHYTWFAGNTTIADISEVLIFVNPISFTICTSTFSKLSFLFYFFNSLLLAIRITQIV